MRIDPSQYSDSVWTRAVKDRDTEIERLKERIQVLKDKVEAGRVELRQQWERMQTENLALKAEIERLREENAHFAWRDADKNKLITELCDALESIKACETVEELSFSITAMAQHWAWTQKLLQRAREATAEEYRRKNQPTETKVGK